MAAERRGAVKEIAKTIVAFSGGKDSHLVLMKASAAAAGGKPGLLYLDGGSKHFGYFNDFRNPELFRALAQELGLEAYVQKMDGFGYDAAFIGRAWREASVKIGKAGAFYLGLPGASGKGGLPASVRGAGGGTACVYPMLGVSPADAFREARRLGFKMLVTGAVARESRGFLGKLVDEAFMRQIGEFSEKGKGPDNFDLQTLVLKSPLMKRELRVLKSRQVDTAGGERHLEILKWDFK